MKHLSIITTWVGFFISSLTYGQCTSAMYLSQNSPTGLFSINTTTSPFTYSAIGGTSGFTYNAIGINPLNGIMYGMSNTYNLLRIDNTGAVVNLGAVTGLPTTTPYVTGDFDSSGFYYVKEPTSSVMYKINIATLTATAVTLSASINIGDMAFNPVTGLFYSVNSSTGQFLSINPTTGVITGIGAAPGSQVFGAMYASNTGEIYGNLNAGGFFQFNITNGQRNQISLSPSSTTNDGAHCSAAPITFGSDLSVTKTDGTTTYASGTTTTYTVTVGNNGPFGVVNATVSDPVPVGIPGANVSYTAVAAGGAATSVVATQTGAINDIVTVPVGGTITYTIVMTIPFMYNGNLVNTVTVTPPTNIIDTNTTNNTATDTDTDTQAVCYKSAITVGTMQGATVGISSLSKTGPNDGSWPMVRKGAWIALESKTKGFVPNRLTTAQITAIPPANLVEGMMVYNTILDCLQINTTGTPAGWKCLDIQTCPN